MQDLLVRAATRFPERVAVLLLDETWTFARLYERALQFGAALQGSGVTGGARVALLMENGADYVSAYFGAFLAGAVVVPLDPKAQPASLARILSDCNVAHLVATNAQLPLALKMLHTKSPLWIIVPHASAVKVDGHHILVADLQRSEVAEVRRQNSSPAVINYTSGSSGRSKGVTLSHRGILANTRSIIASLGLTGHDRMMQILPFSYCYGASLLHTHFFLGGSLVIDNRFLYPSVVVEHMNRTRCTGFAGVPSTFHTLATRCGIQSLRQQTLRYMTQAGGHLRRELVDAIRDAIMPAKLFVMYGQTEASARITCMDPDQCPDRPGNVGKPIPGVSLRIMSETGEELPQGAVGEVWVRGENVMTEYWGQPEETAQVLVDGWLRTGDLGRVEPDGCLYIEGRLKSIIKSNGYRISPGEVEAALIHHPQVDEACVLGLPDAQTGEIVAAVVALKKGSLTGASELVQHCKSMLAPHQVPGRVLLVNELPKSAAGKIQKDALVVLFN